MNEDLLAFITTLDTWLSVITSGNAEDAMSTAGNEKFPRTIVLIHGLWMTALSWENWANYYTRKGYNVIAKSWPGLDGDIEEIRRNPSSIASLGVTEVVEHYAGIIKELNEPPIIIGHSFGALVTQLLVDRGMGAAGVAIATAPIKGILLLPFSTLKVSFPALSNPLNNHRAVPLTPEQFHYAFMHTSSEAESLAMYKRYAVPGPDHILFQAGFANFIPHAATEVNVKNNNRAPLLFIAGDKDHIAPPSVVKASVKLYRHSSAITDYKEFPERTHFILGQDGWNSVADYALDWAGRHARARIKTPLNMSMLATSVGNDGLVEPQSAIA